MSSFFIRASKAALVLAGCSGDEQSTSETGTSLDSPDQDLNEGSSLPIDLRDVTVLVEEHDGYHDVLLAENPQAWPSAIINGRLARPDPTGCSELEQAGSVVTLIWPANTTFEGESVFIEGHDVALTAGDDLRAGGGRLDPKNVEQMIGGPSPCSDRAYVVINPDTIELPKR